jgi:WD40 repeat protein
MMKAQPLLVLTLFAAATRADEPRRDRFGDSLPPGAIARLGTMQAHVGVEGIAFSADGKTLMSWSRHAVRHWDATTGRVTKLIERRLPEDAWLQVISADGRTAATVWRDRLHIHDVESNRLRHRVALPPFDDMTALLVSADGGLVFISLMAAGDRPLTTLAVRTDSGTVERWPGVTLFRAVLSPNAQRIAGTEVVDGRRRVSCRDASGKLLCRLPFDGRPVAFTPDGTRLLAYTEDKKGELVLVDTATGTRRDARLPKTGGHPEAAFSPNGRLLAIVTWREVMLWDMQSGKTVHFWPGRAAHPTFSPDGKRLAATNERMHCWNVETGKALWPDYGPMIGRDHEHVPFFSRPAGNLLATGDAERRRVLVWDWTSGESIFVSPAVDGLSREAMWLTPDGARAFVCTEERVLGWELAGGKEVHNFRTRPTVVTAHDWYVARESPDGKAVSVLMPKPTTGEMWRGWLMRWDVATGRVLDRPEFEARYRDYLRILPSGRHVSDRELLWDAVTGRRQTVAVAPRGFEISMPLEFSADGRLAVANLRSERIDGPGELVVWETATGQPLLRRPTGKQQTIQAAISPDNRWLALAAEQSIELWDLAIGQRAAELKYRTPDVVQMNATYYCLGLMFLPGRRLIAAYGDRTALFWQMPPETEKPPPQRLSERTFDDLATPEPRVAQNAVWALVNEPAKAMPLLRERIKPAGAIADSDVRSLVTDLADTNFVRREAALRRLHELGHGIEKTLEAAAARTTNTEQSRRLKSLLDACRDDGPMNAAERRALRAIQALGIINSPDARSLLESWSKGDAAAILTREAKAALECLR